MTSEIRLNHYGRPWGVPRAHLNWRGTPKPAKTREDAIGYALRLSHERALRLRSERRGTPVDAYECGHCGAWHVGTQKKEYRGVPTLYWELGDRAWFNLKAENSGSGERRLQAVIRRLGVRLPLRAELARRRVDASTRSRRRSRRRS